MTSLNIDFATPSDVPLVLSFIRELAAYEKLEHEVEATEKDLHRSLFGEKPECEAVIARWDGKPAGFALYFHSYSTFLARKGLYLEDLFVRPEFRGEGIGKAIFAFLAKLATQRNCPRFEWWVLDWNKKAIDFYKAMGAEPMGEWTVYRLTEGKLGGLAKHWTGKLPPGDHESRHR